MHINENKPNLGSTMSARILSQILLLIIIQRLPPKKEALSVKNRKQEQQSVITPTTVE